MLSQFRAIERERGEQPKERQARSAALEEAYTSSPEPMATICSPSYPRSSAAGKGGIMTDVPLFMAGFPHEVVLKPVEAETDHVIGNNHWVVQRTIRVWIVA